MDYSGVSTPTSARKVSAVPLGASPTIQDEHESSPRGGPCRKYSLSSYEHPYDIAPPNEAYAPSSVTNTGTEREQARLVSSGHFDPAVETDEKQEQKRQGLTESIMDWYSTTRSGTHEVPHQTDMKRAQTYSDDGSFGDNIRRRDSNFSNMSSDTDDPDDGEKQHHTNEADLEKNALRQMDYRTRRKHIQRIRIEFNVSCE